MKVKGPTKGSASLKDATLYIQKVRFEKAGSSSVMKPGSPNGKSIGSGMYEMYCASNCAAQQKTCIIGFDNGFKKPQTIIIF